MNKNFPGRKAIIFKPWEIWFRFERLSGHLSISRPGTFKIGYYRDYYDGDFYHFGFWFFVILWTNNPHFYYTSEEIDENIAFNEKRWGHKNHLAKIGSY